MLNETTRGLSNTEFGIAGGIIFLLGFVAVFINADMFFNYWLRKSDGNIILGYFSIVNILLISCMYPLIIIAYLATEWIWGSYGCSYYGFLALFLGFCQMHVPIIVMLDKHFEQVDPDYEEETKQKKRIIMVTISFLISLFFGAVPLFTWTPMTFEPSYLSCSVYDAKPGIGYISYIWATLVVYEIVPLAIVVWILIISSKSEKNAKKEMIKPILSIIGLIVAWTPLTLVYCWPLFGNPANMPMRLVAWSPPFAKLTALVVPIILFE